MRMEIEVPLWQRLVVAMLVLLLVSGLSLSLWMNVQSKKENDKLTIENAALKAEIAEWRDGHAASKEIQLFKFRTVESGERKFLVTEFQVAEKLAPGTCETVSRKQDGQRDYSAGIVFFGCPELKK